MNISRIINFICIIVGGLIAFYANAQEKQNIYLLLGGIVLLMFGILTLLMILAFGVTTNSASSTKLLWLNTYASKVSTIWIIAGSFTIVSFAILQVSSLFSLSSWFIEAGDVSTQNQIKIKQYFDKGMNILFKLY